MVNSEELIGTAEYLTLWTRCGISRCLYNRVRLYLNARILCSSSESSTSPTYLTHKNALRILRHVLRMVVPEYKRRPSGDTRVNLG